MTREIKFRGKTSAGIWVYGGYYYEKELNEHRIITDSIDSELICESVDVIPKTVSQFTGLKDKNGKEIYEGDIISDWVKTDEGLIQSKQQVFWNEATGSWHLDFSSEQDESESIELWLELNDFEYEVTGNVHEDR